MNESDETVKRFRALCLGLPETSEVSSWGHPNFRAGKRTFATVEWVKGRPSFAFRLGANAVDEIRHQDSRTFVTPYGRGQWLSIWIDRRVDWRLVRALVDRSYRMVALKRMIISLDGAPEDAG